MTSNKEKDPCLICDDLGWIWFEDKSDDMGNPYTFVKACGCNPWRRPKTTGGES
jgi:hypothetical protein